MGRLASFFIADQRHVPLVYYLCFNSALNYSETNIRSAVALSFPHDLVCSDADPCFGYSQVLNVCEETIHRFNTSHAYTKALFDAVPPNWFLSGSNLSSFTVMDEFTRNPEFTSEPFTLTSLFGVI